jgi:SSS family solute:Na+ symporter
MAKWVSLIVKFGALLFILALPQQYAIQLQLLGGVWIVQTFPAVILGLYTRWLDPRALLLGWAAGIASGTWMAAALHFKGSIYPLMLFGWMLPGYAAFYSFVLNLIVAFVLSALFRAANAATDADETVAADYR